VSPEGDGAGRATPRRRFNKPLKGALQPTRPQLFFEYMNQSNHTTPTLLTADQIEAIRKMVTPARPLRRTQRRGLKVLAELINVLHSNGWKDFEIYDLEFRLRELGLVATVWPNVKTDTGLAKVCGDACGGHGLRLATTNGKRGEAKRYVIPPNGIDRAYCEANLIDLGAEATDHDDQGKAENAGE
jgi:hypothetical protein